MEIIVWPMRRQKRIGLKSGSVEIGLKSYIGAPNEATQDYQNTKVYSWLLEYSR